MKYLVCLLFGHNYYVAKVFNPSERKLGCSRCRRFYGMNDRVKCLIPWDGELEEMYQEGL